MRNNAFLYSEFHLGQNFSLFLVIKSTFHIWFLHWRLSCTQGTLVGSRVLLHTGKDIYFNLVHDPELLAQEGEREFAPSLKMKGKTLLLEPLYAQWKICVVLDLSNC